MEAVAPLRVMHIFPATQRTDAVISLVLTIHPHGEAMA